MIQPINISALNTTADITFECEKCGFNGATHFTNRLINVDSTEKIKEEIGGLDCWQCGQLIPF